jgi:TPR repeat protein
LKDLELVLQSAAVIDLSKTNRATGGLMYLRGQGIPADIVEARKWFVLAAAGGDPNGADNLSKLARV